MSPGELAAKYKEVLTNKDPQKVIVHCGSGVTACHTLLALAEAGLARCKPLCRLMEQNGRDQRGLLLQEKNNTAGSRADYHMPARLSFY